MNEYYIYRLEHGQSAAEQRAADRRAGELAAALADARRTVAFSVGRGFRTLKSLSRMTRTSKKASLATGQARP